nr:MAG TPA: hypothetical protein [Caudoviricetes sp.]
MATHLPKFPMAKPFFCDKSRNRDGGGILPLKEQF